MTSTDVDGVRGGFWLILLDSGLAGLSRGSASTVTMTPSWGSIEWRWDATLASASAGPEFRQRLKGVGDDTRARRT